MKHFILTAVCCVLAACATTQTKVAEKKGEPVVEKMVITNIIPFDIASCGPRALELTPVTTEVVLGALLSMGPSFQECFVDAKALEGAMDAKLKATVGPEVTFEITGTGLSASGKACVTAAAKKLAFKPLEAGAKPVVAELPLQTGVKSVVFGTNVASDAVGALRLAQPMLCECYAEIGAKAPPMLVAKVTLAKEKPAEVSIEPNDAQTVSDCVVAKLKTVTLPAADATLGYPFLLKNSYATAVTTGAPAALQFQQLDGAREQRTADVLIAGGKHTAAANAYDAVVTRYKAKQDYKLVPELKTRCAAVVASNDLSMSTLGGLKANFDESLALVQGEMQKPAADPSWAAVEAKLKAQVAGTTAEMTRVEGQKKNDQGACPKSK